MGCSITFLKGEEMYESPITFKIVEDMSQELIKKENEVIIRYSARVVPNITEEELIKALQYDRGQYEKGFRDGKAARDAEIVRCKDCKSHNWCTIEDEARDESFFCKWGERRTT